ncbi:MAG: carbohydrate ABC transporter permease [Herpetosiphonaceae bacterium]|nr:carbohydrate ABC transporter permease [Herpetosiphonaceae bacterium]
MNVRKPLSQRVTLHTILILGSIVMAFPLVFAAAASLTTQADFIRSPWFPKPTPTLLNYRVLLFSADKFPRWVFNTLVRIVWFIVLPATVAVLCGYVFARLRFRGRSLAFGILLGSMLVPGIVYQVPLFVMLARWPLAGGNNLLGQGGSGFINHWPALLLPGIVNVYYIFLLRQTFTTIPSDYEEAARLDGANTFQILTRVYLPMLVPVLMVLVIFQSVNLWNDYVWPLISVSANPQVWPIGLGLQRVMAGAVPVPGLQGFNQPFIFTVATVSMVPTILLFLFFQRYFLEGVQGFGVKG